MAISDDELTQIFSLTGIGKVPAAAVIAQTIPLDKSANGAFTPSTGVMELYSIYIPVNCTIKNITFVNGGTPESSGTHLWYALYDDGRGSTTAGQLALLMQTGDQTGSAAMGAQATFTLALQAPWITKYTGIYYVAFMCVATQVPNLAGNIRSSGCPIQLAPSAGAFFSGTAGSGLTTSAPNPSGAVTFSTKSGYAYVS